MNSNQLLALVISVIIAAVLPIVLVVYEKKVNDKVISTSPKIKALMELNQKVKFHQVQSYFEIVKHYDNKSNFNKIQPAFLMTADIRANINFFSNYVNQIKENREINKKYYNEIENIISSMSFVDYDAIKMSERSYNKREKALFSKRIITPVLGCTFNVYMYYSSPKGRVNLEKSDSFEFDELITCLESVSRTYLDRDAYSRMAAVERGEVSDSLRYDILSRDNFCCVICGASASLGARLHVDHIVPISKGGKSIPSNLRTLCERCNVGKSNKMETGFDNQLKASDVNRSDSARSTNSTSQKSIICDQCGANMVVRNGQYGKFYGCTNYPNCRNIKKIQH